MKCDNDDKVCSKLGKDHIARYALAAKRLVREVPEFRANVVAWRVREAIRAADDLKAARAVAPTHEYSLALEEATPTRLYRLFPNWGLYRMSRSVAPDYVARGEMPAGKSGWYMRLSGECAGFEDLADLALNAKAACTGLDCGGAEVKEESKGKHKVVSPLTDSEPPLRKEDNEWDRNKARACVIAPLPSLGRVLEDQPRTNSTNIVLMNASSNYLGQLGYYKQLRDAGADGSVASAIELATFVRPPSVALWRPVDDERLSDRPPPKSTKRVADKATAR